MRETLIEMLCEAEAARALGISMEECADHLVANGVVVREKGEWQYTEDIDEDNNIKAYCSACGAGDKHATSMVGKVPYCWKCGADMRKEKNNA